MIQTPVNNEKVVQLHEEVQTLKQHNEIIVQQNEVFMNNQFMRKQNLHFQVLTDLFKFNISTSLKMYQNIT